MSERPSPHSITVCTLIALKSDPSSQIKVSTGFHSDSNQRDDHNSESHLSALIEYLVLSNDALLEMMSLDQLLFRIAGDNCICFHVANRLLEDLQQSCTSVDALVDLFAALRSTMASGIVDANSAHGVFIRRRCLGFDQLPFEAVSRLWEAFSQYVYQGTITWQNAANTHSHSNTTNAEASPHSHDNLLDASSWIGSMVSSFSTFDWALSARQISCHIHSQCQQIHRVIGVVPFVIVEHSLQQILTYHPEMITAHYLRFLNCYFHDDRLSALEHLHRYFDYAMIFERKERLLSGSPSSTLSPDSETTIPSSKNIVQYAPIVLASLFQRFGNIALARKATEEAVRIAQQTGDEICMAYALGWLHTTRSLLDHSLDSECGNDEDQLLQRTLSRASRFNLPSLFAGASLKQAQHFLSHGGEGLIHHWKTKYPSFQSSNRIVPALVWDYISSASVLDHYPTGVDANATYSSMSDQPTSLSPLSRTEDTLDTFCQQGCMTATVWAAFGNAPLCTATYRMVQNCFSPIMSSDQIVVAALQTVSMICYGASHHNTSRARLHRHCKSRATAYERIWKDLQELKQKVPRALDSIWLYTEFFLRNEFSARQKSFHDALSYQLIIHSYSPILYKYGDEYLIDAMASSILLCIQERQFVRAKELSEEVCSICQRLSLHGRHAYYLLQTSLIYIANDDPIGSLPSLLSCLSICDSKLIDSTHAAAMSLLANVYFILGDKASANMLKAVIPRLLQYGLVWFLGEAWLTLAKCTLVNAQEKNKAVWNKRGQKEAFQRALSELCESEMAFLDINDVVKLREVYYLKSHVYNALGQLTQRNDEAQKFLDINVQLVKRSCPLWANALGTVLQTMRLGELKL